MLDVITTVLEAVGIVLAVVAVALVVAALAGVPLGLAAGAASCWLASWLLQGAPLPRRSGGHE